MTFQTMMEISNPVEVVQFLAHRFSQTVSKKRVFPGRKRSEMLENTKEIAFVGRRPAPTRRGADWPFDEKLQF